MIEDRGACNEWLRGHLSVLGTTDPGASLDDLGAVGEVIGDARVVGLGEGAHFVEEFWAVRCRLVRFLQERLGFDVVAAEFGVAAGDDLGAWVEDPSDPRSLGEVSPEAVDWGMSWAAEWLRTRNEVRGSGLGFVGIDAPNGGAAFAATWRTVAEFLGAVDPDSRPTVEGLSRIAGSLAGTSVARTAAAWAALGEAKQEALTAGLSRLGRRVRALDEVFAERGGRAGVDRTRRYLDALACADYAMRANDAMHRGAEWVLDHSVRDRFMADSVLSLLERRPGSRVAILAHNGHIQKMPVVWGDYLSAEPMGLYLERALGDDYRAIGTTTVDDHTSEMQIDLSTEVGFTVVDQSLPAPETGSLEAAVVSAGFGDRPTFVALRGAPATGPSFDRIRAQSGYLTGDVKAGYDGVVVVPRVTVQRDLGF